jgi:hypothetical protein
VAIFIAGNNDTGNATISACLDKEVKISKNNYMSVNTNPTVSQKI